MMNFIDCLYSNYEINAIDLTLLPLGADMGASVYKLGADDGQSYFVKLKQGVDVDIGVTLLAWLQASGIQEIIPPIKTKDGKLTQLIDGSTLIVYPFVDGQNGFSALLTDDQWIAFGKVLKQIHQLDVPELLARKIKQETYSSKWRDIVRSFDTTMNDNLAKTFMKEHQAIIQRLVNRAEVLSQMVQKLSPKLVLCHSDIHAGNVLIDKKGGFYIIDWDEPIMAPKERDLMFIGGGVGNVWNHPHEEELFYQGYGNTEIDKTILSYYRHERIVQDIVEYGQAPLLTQEMYTQFTDMFSTNGVIDIAFKTDIDS